MLAFDRVCSFPRDGDSSRTRSTILRNRPIVVRAGRQRVNLHGMEAQIGAALAHRQLYVTKTKRPRVYLIDRVCEECSLCGYSRVQHNDRALTCSSSRDVYGWVALELQGGSSQQPGHGACVLSAERPNGPYGDVIRAMPVAAGWRAHAPDNSDVCSCGSQRHSLHSATSSSNALTAAATLYCFLCTSVPFEFPLVCARCDVHTTYEYISGICIEC